MINVHHLELFYYVAQHGGISAAVRHIPYGIQQPAVSGQMSRLEEEVGAKLFERSPFKLTPAGTELFAHVQPFFEGLGPLVERLRGVAAPALRVGGSELVLREHIPVVMRGVRAQHPQLRLSLRSGYQRQLEGWLRDDEIDVAIGPIGPRPPARMRQLRLAQVPLVLLVPSSAPVKTAEELWAQKKIAIPLIGLPAGTSVMENFQSGLKRRRVTWPQAMEAASIELVTRYVVNGEGFGVSLGIPAIIRHRGIRALALDDFEPMTMGVLWRGEPSAPVRAVIEEVRRYSQATWPDWSVADPLP